MLYFIPGASLKQEILNLKMGNESLYCIYQRSGPSIYRITKTAQCSWERELL